MAWCSVKEKRGTGTSLPLHEILLYYKLGHNRCIDIWCCWTV